MDTHAVEPREALGACKADRALGVKQLTHPLSQMPKDSKCIAALTSKMRKTSHREVKFLAQGPQLKSRRHRIRYSGVCSELNLTYSA